VGQKDLSTWPRHPSVKQAGLEERFSALFHTGQRSSALILYEDFQMVGGNMFL